MKNKWLLLLALLAALLLAACGTSERKGESEAFEIARAQAQGFSDGYDAGFEDGKAEGYQAGYEAGLKDGRSSGYEDGGRFAPADNSSSPTPAPRTTPGEQTVYITRTGSKYHRDGCQYLHQSKIPISLSDAQARGYTACSKCW